MQPEIRYVVASSFSKWPGGRKRANGTHSGEEFREDVVRDLLNKYEVVIFDLSDSAGYSSGFLDEAFGGLLQYFGLAEIKRRVKIEANDDPGAVEIAWARIHDAAKERVH